MTHGQRDKIWLPKHGLIDTKTFGAFTCFSEARYPEAYPDEKGGGAIEGTDLTARFVTDLGFLPKVEDEFRMSRETVRKISRLQDSLYGLSPRKLLEKTPRSGGSPRKMMTESSLRSPYKVTDPSPRSPFL